VINPPDGDMKDYIDSLRRLRTLNCAALLPGHGDRIDDPVRAIDWIIDHRLEREARVLAALKQHPGLSARNLVPHVYQDVAEHLFRLAERSLLAHLLKLQRDGIAVMRQDTWSATHERE
jgi:glyoxylase-like metal-dependent hydrolase (beta-lactamase superfamily II)